MIRNEEGSTGNGSRRETAQRHPADQRREAGQLDPQGVAVPGHLRAGLLRDRDDDDRRAALRPRPVRHGGLPGIAAAGRPDDRRRPGEPEDGAGAAADLRPDGGAEVGAVDGRVRLVRRHVQQLRDRPGRRPHRPGGHVPAGLPAAAGDADRRHPQAARQDHGRAARAETRRRTAAASAPNWSRHRSGTASLPAPIGTPRGQHSRTSSGPADRARGPAEAQPGERMRPIRGGADQPPAATTAPAATPRAATARSTPRARSRPAPPRTPRRRPASPAPSPSAACTTRPRRWRATGRRAHRHVRRPRFRGHLRATACWCCEPYAPVPAERPYGGYFDEVADALVAAMAERSIPS